MQNVLAKHEMFEEIGGGETSKQGQEVESVACQANNVGQFRQAFSCSWFFHWIATIVQVLIIHLSYNCE